MEENLKRILYIIIVVLVGAIGLQFNKITNSKIEKNKKLKTYKVNYNKAFNNNNVKLDINSVDKDELIARGISEKMAIGILDYRSIVGNIRNIDELTRVKGIGIKRLEKLNFFFVVKDKKLEINKLNINNADEINLKYFGFNKKEIKKILKWRKEKGSIYSNLDLKEIIGEKRYFEIWDRIEY